MTLNRGDLQTLSWLVSQFFDAADLVSGAAYDRMNLSTSRIPGLYAARMGFVANPITGIPQLKTVAGTESIVNPMVLWPADGHSSRVLGQGNWCFPAQITSASPLWAQPIQKSDGTLDPGLDAAFPVTVMPGSTTPAVGDKGLVVMPSRLDAQDPIFVPLKGTSSGGGSSFPWGDASDGNIHLDGSVGGFVPDYWFPTVSSSNPLGYLISQATYPDAWGGSPTGDPGNPGNPYAISISGYTNGLKIYFLWGPLYADMLTIDSGVTLYTNGFPIFCKKLVGSGTIDNSPGTFYGQAASTSGGVRYWDKPNVGGNPIPNLQPANFPSLVNFTYDGPNDATLSVANGGQSTQTNTIHVINASDAGNGISTGGLSSYARGGAGGNGDGGTGGGDQFATGQAHAPRGGAPPGMGARTLMSLVLTVGVGGAVAFFASQGGSSGAGDGTANDGGEPGKGGGWVSLNAEDMSSFTGTLRAHGQDGETPTTFGGTGNVGGGGGGSGGLVVALTDASKTPSKSWTVDVGGGLGGSGHGTGTNGSAGSSGYSTGTYP